MALGDRTYQWAMHTAWGYPFNLLQNVIETTGGYTHHRKKVSAATAAAVLSSTAGTTSQQVITAGITNPDVPRVLAITTGGSGISAGNVVLTGYNVEGKLITDTIAMNTSGGQTLGTLVFKRVTSVTIPAALGASGTLTVDTTNKIGLNHRCPSGYTTIVAVYDTAISNGASPTSSRPVLDAAVSSSNVDGQFVEKNWVVTAKAVDGTTFFYYFYWFYKALVYPPKDSPEFYSTTTSTSTSSTSTSTSFSSTSTSISTSSTSTSATTISTSSTSTSTTTLPV